jgi:hypothetical protein
VGAVAVRRNPGFRAFQKPLVAPGRGRDLARTACLRKLALVLEAVRRE